jgi:hypothetical protein
MELVSNELIRELMNERQAPCVSLYMPTHRSHPDNLQDKTRFKNLMKQVLESLSDHYPDDLQSISLTLEEIKNNDELWNHTLDGIAIFIAQGYVKIARLHERVDELAILSANFHTKPLLYYLQSLDRFFILGISISDMQLYQGNRYVIDQLTLPAEAPHSLSSALGDELTDKHLTVASYDGSGGEGAGMHHGHGGRKDEVGKDAEKYFRIVADYIYENYSKKIHWPVILAALTEHHNLFKKVNKNPFLLSDGITVHPSSTSDEKLLGFAWEIMEAHYAQEINKLIERFNKERANSLGSDNMEEVAFAATQSRVDTVLIESDRIIPGSLIKESGKIKKDQLDNPIEGDLLDEIAVLVIRQGGEIRILPQDKMPSKTGIAAIFRF